MEFVNLRCRVSEIESIQYWKSLFVNFRKMSNYCSDCGSAGHACSMKLSFLVANPYFHILVDDVPTCRGCRHPLHLHADHGKIVFPLSRTELLTTRISLTLIFLLWILVNREWDCFSQFEHRFIRCLFIRRESLERNKAGFNSTILNLSLQAALRLMFLFWTYSSCYPVCNKTIRSSTLTGNLITRVPERENIKALVSSQSFSSAIRATSLVPA